MKREQTAEKNGQSPGVEGSVAGRTSEKAPPQPGSHYTQPAALNHFCSFTPADLQQKSPPDGNPGTAWILLTSRTIRIAQLQGTLIVPATLEKLPGALRVWPKLLP